MDSDNDIHLAPMDDDIVHPDSSSNDPVTITATTEDTLTGLIHLLIEDVFLVLIEFVEPVDRAMIAQTCKHWKQLLGSRFPLAEALFLEAFRTGSMEQIDFVTTIPPFRYAPSAMWKGFFMRHELGYDEEAKNKFVREALTGSLEIPYDNVSPMVIHGPYLVDTVYVQLLKTIMKHTQWAAPPVRPSLEEMLMYISPHMMYWSINRLFDDKDLRFETNHYLQVAQFNSDEDVFGIMLDYHDTNPMTYVPLVIQLNNTKNWKYLSITCDHIYSTLGSGPAFIIGCTLLTLDTNECMDIFLSKYNRETVYELGDLWKQRVGESVIMADKCVSMQRLMEARMFTVNDEVMTRVQQLHLSDDMRTILRKYLNDPKYNNTIEYPPTAAYTNNNDAMVLDSDVNHDAEGYTFEYNRHDDNDEEEDEENFQDNSFEAILQQHHDDDEDEKEEDEDFQ
jgi:hypothetical protein